MRRLYLIVFSIGLLATAGFSQTRQDIVDDGFTWFEAYSTTELTGNNIPTATGWTLKYWVRTIGSYPDGSGYNFVISKAGRQVFSTRCGAWAYRRQGADVDESFLRTAECWLGKAATKETGEFDVQVFTVNGQTGAEKLVRTYKIDVRAIARVPSGQAPGTEPPRYIVNRHNEAPVAFIFLRPTGYVPYLEVADRPERSGGNQVELHFSLSPSEQGIVPPYADVACSAGGKPVAMPGPMPYATQATSIYERFHQETYQDRLALRFKAGMPYEEKIRFQNIRMTLPLTWRRTNENRASLDDYKGDWQCTIGKNGEVWRTIRFRVGTNGMPELHPEQRANVNLGYNSYLVDMEIPVGGSALDGRLAGPSNSFFYGQLWTTAEGKTMAARVPKKGNAFPIPSNSQKVVTPLGGRP